MNFYLFKQYETLTFVRTMSFPKFLCCVNIDALAANGAFDAVFVTHSTNLTCLFLFSQIMA